MIIKKVVVKLCFVVLLPIYCFCQTDKKLEFIKHRNQYLVLTKLPPSLRRDTSMIIQLDSLMLIIDHTDRKIVKEFNEQFILNLIKKHAQSNNWVKGKAIYNLWFALHGLAYSGQFITAFKYYSLAESQFEKIKDFDHQAYTLIRLSLNVIYNYKGIYDELKYIEKAEVVAKKANNKNLIFGVLNTKGEYYYAKNDYKNALKVYNEYETLNDPNQSSNLTNKLNIGCSLLFLDSLNTALKYLNIVFKQLPNKSIHDKYLRWSAYNELIAYYLKKRNFTEAKKYLLKVREYSNREELKLTYPKFVYEVEKGLGNYKVALEALEKYQYYVLEDKKKIEQNNIEGMKSQVALHEQAEKLQKAELEKLRSENAKQNQTRWFWAVLSIIGIFSTIYVLLTNKSLKNKNEALLNKNSEISAALLQGQTIERQRVAADLHDNLGSTMSSLIWTMEAIDANKLQPKEKDVYQSLKSMLSKAYDEVRMLSHNLLPEEFEKQGLKAALQYFVRKVNNNSSIKFDLQIDETLDKLDKKVEFELYSICLELVNNIIKHSKATEAKIEISKTESQIKLTVKDNGIGIFENNSDGKGMKNVRARVESLNGTWNIKSFEKQGVVSQIIVPI